MRVAPRMIEEMALEAGFDLVGFGPCDPGEDGERFLAWLAAGRHGEMHYLERHRQSMRDPTSWAPSARATVSLGYDYGNEPFTLAGGGRIARYAVGRDYHRHLGKRLRRLRTVLERDGVPRGAVKIGTDAVPVLERALAVRAGVGFLAKSAGVIHPRLGPYLHLAEMLVPFELPHDLPAAGTCGTCTACLDACPTGAIVAPHEVEARRCLSYTTIELRGPIPVELRAPQQDRLFGCDVCLEVCPFARKSPRAAGTSARPPELAPHRALETYTLVGILEITPEQWDRDWTGTAVRRATRSGLRRNAAVVLGNLGDPDATAALERALSDPDPIVRGHAAWALGRLGTGRAALERALRRERDAAVTEEIRAALEGATGSAAATT